MSDEISGLMRALQERAEQSKPPTRPVMEAQRHELRLRWDAYHAEQPAFVGGEIVRFKHGLGSWKAEPRTNHAFLFWRYVDPTNWLDQQIIIEQVENMPIRPNTDCFIASISDGGEGTALMLADSREFERDPEAAT